MNPVNPINDQEQQMQMRLAPDREVIVPRGMANRAEGAAQRVLPQVQANLAKAIEKADYAELFEIASKTLPSVSFWGTHTIRTVNYEGKAPIDLLAKRVIELVRANNFEYTEEERTIGKKMAKEITRIYTDADKEVSKSNYITQLFCAIKKVFYQFQDQKNSPIARTVSLVRHHWMDFVNDTSYVSSEYSDFKRVFDYYTLKQFVEKYKKEPAGYSDLFGGRNLPRVQLALGR